MNMVSISLLNAILLATVAIVIPPSLVAQRQSDDRLYDAMLRPNNSEFGAAVKSWVGARRDSNPKFVAAVNQVSETSGDKAIRFNEVLAKHEPADAKVLHEYSEDGLSRALTIADPRTRRDIVESLRWVEDLEDKVEARSKSTRPNSPELRASVDRYASVLLDLDAKMRASMANASLECEVTAHTVDPKAKPEDRARRDHEVVYVLEFWAHDPSRWRTFNTLSTPTSQKLTAGYYIMWCRRDDSGTFVDGPRKRVVVNRATIVDLVTPKKS
jgi:hypothetical protein